MSSCLEREHGVLKHLWPWILDNWLLVLALQLIHCVTWVGQLTNPLQVANSSNLNRDIIPGTKIFLDFK